jgi:NADPH-dependent curcumin reductase
MTVTNEPLRNRRIVLATRPVGIPTTAHFRRDDRPVPELLQGQFLIRNRYLSVDPAQRGWVNASSNYSDPVPIGEVMRALAVGEVVASRQPAISVGSHYYGWFGWQDYCVATDQLLLARVHEANAPLSAALGVLGINGITAYLALLDLGQPKAGETVLVSTAAGAVGSIVGQIARRSGCQVLGLTGSAAKVDACVREFGYHQAFNYRDGLDGDRLRALCPRGVDVYFDNVSGPISDAVWPHLNTGARIVQCGTASIAQWDDAPAGPRHDRDILTKRLSWQGFVIFDHVARFDEVIGQLAAWIRDGSLRYREQVLDGLDAAPAALEALYRGDNSGKMIIRL